MPNIACPRSVRCPGTDSPVSNFSSEAVDGVDYFGRRWPIWDDPHGPLPPIGGVFHADSCLGIQTAPTQELADLLAALAAQICALGDDPDGTTDDGPPSVPPIDPPDSPISPVEPGVPTTTTTVTPTIYYNTAQNCLWVCPDGTTLSHVVDAGYFSDTTQALADQRAYQYACQQVARNRMCFSSLNSAACLGQEYDEVLVVTKGIGVITPVTFTVIAGAIPDGIVMTSALPAFLGLSFFGTPTTAGNYSFTIQAVPVFGATITKTFTINVLGITNCPLPDATLNDPYSEVLSASGGTAPYTFTGDPVTIPDWMTIDSNGTVHGIPDEELLFEFEVTVTDDNGQSCVQQCSVNVLPADECLGVPSTIAGLTWVNQGPVSLMVGFGQGSGALVGGGGTGWVQADYPGLDSMNIVNMYFGAQFCNPTDLDIILTANVTFVSSGNVYIDPPPGHLYVFGISSQHGTWPFLVNDESDSGVIYPADAPPVLTVHWTVAAHTTLSLWLRTGIQCSAAPAWARVDFAVTIT